MDRREAIKMGVAAVAAVTAPGAVVEAFDKEGGVPTIGPGDVLIVECDAVLTPDHHSAIDAAWDKLFEGKGKAPKIVVLGRGLTLAGIVKGEGE